MMRRTFSLSLDKPVDDTLATYKFLYTLKQASKFLYHDMERKDSAYEIDDSSDDEEIHDIAREKIIAVHGDTDLDSDDDVEENEKVHTSIFVEEDDERPIGEKKQRRIIELPQFLMLALNAFRYW